jgi:hypothetical protein
LRIIEFLDLSVKDLEKLTGKKMNWGARMSFRILKGRMRRAIKKDPVLTVNEFMISQNKMKTWVLLLIIVVFAGFIAFLVLALLDSGAV